MRFGKLDFEPVSENLALVADPIQSLIRQGDVGDGVLVSAIDPDLADTAAFCEAYDIAPELGANLIVVEAKRADQTWYAACLILASAMVDVNNKVRRYLDARRVSFAPRDKALALTGMEYGGISSIGLPPELPLLIDERVMSPAYVIVGSGIRGSKLLVQPSVIAARPGAVVLDITKPR